MGAKVIQFPVKAKSDFFVAEVQKWQPVEVESAAFEVGKTYTTRSIGDSNCIISVTIARRTAKRVTTTEGKTFGVGTYEGVEFIKPWGNYSMAPIIRAKR